MSEKSMVATTTSDKQTEAPVVTPQPMFRRYQIAVKAGVRVGAVPTGRPPIGF